MIIKTKPVGSNRRILYRRSLSAVSLVSVKLVSVHMWKHNRKLDHALDHAGESETRQIVGPFLSVYQVDG